MEQDKQLQNYVDKVLQIQQAQQSRGKLQEEDLKMIAQEIGVDWLQVKKSLQDHFKRAEEFAKRQLWTDAIEEYQQVLILFPSHTDALSQCAFAHLNQWKENDQVENKKLAEKLARETLQIQADNHLAFDVLAGLKTEKNVRLNHKIQTAKTPQKPNKAVVIAIAMAVLVMMFIVAWALMPMSPLEEYSTERLYEETTSESSASSDQIIETPKENFDLDMIEVNFDAPKWESFLSLETQESKLTPFSDSYSYKFKGKLVAKGIEIDKAKFKLEWLNSQQQVIYTDYIELGNNLSGSTPYLPGDIMPLNFLKFEKATAPKDLKNVRLSIVSIEQNKAAEKYETGPPLELVWNQNKSPNLDLKATIRYSNITDNSITNAANHKFAFFFENIGNRRIKALKFAVEYYDKEGQVIETCERFLLSRDSAPDILAGENRLYNSVCGLSKATRNKIINYKVRILSIE
ncbi:MAG: hypothetical protein JJT94_17475 [Bernardetiaceae bacterium]|nr:hypothetical protein [Bernardetiaceae bacterium]